VTRRFLGWPHHHAYLSLDASIVKKAHFLFTRVSQIRRTNPRASAATRSFPYQPSPTRSDTGYCGPPQSREPPETGTSAKCESSPHRLSSSLRLHVPLDDEPNDARCTHNVL